MLPLHPPHELPQILVGVALEVVMYPSQAWFRYASCYHTKNQCEMNVYSLRLSKFPLFLPEHQADGR